MPQSDYDKASRFAAKLDPPAFLGWLLGLAGEGFAFRRWLDTRAVPSPGDPDRIGDTVGHLENPAEHGLPWAVAVEFQSQPDPEMFGRLLGYLSGLWLKLKPDAERGSRFHVGAAVVNLTGSGSASREMVWPAASLTTHLRVVERNLEREPAEGLLGEIEAGRWSRSLLPWVPLMAGADDPVQVDRWKVLAEGEPNTRRKAEFGGLAQLFAEKAGRKDLWAEKLRGWNVEESIVVKEWMARGEVRGMALGEARGEARGRAEERAASLLDILTEKYKSVPEDLVAAIRRTADLDQLRAWLRIATNAPDLPAFRQQTGI